MAFVMYAGTATVAKSRLALLAYRQAQLRVNMSRRQLVDAYGGCVVNEISVLEEVQ